MLAHPDVQAEIRRREEAAAKKARDEAAAKAQQDAERAQMAEADRLRAEKTDAETATAAAQAAEAKAARERDIFRYFATSDDRLASPQAASYLSVLVEEKVKAGTPSDQAVAAALKDHPYLLKQATPPAPAAPDTQVQTPPVETPPASPAPPRVTSTPTGGTPPEQVDALKMSDTEFDKWLREGGPGFVYSR